MTRARCRSGSRSSLGKIAFPVVRFLLHHVVTRGTPIGRRKGPQFIAKGDPRVRVKAKDLQAAGVERVPRMSGVRDGRPVLEDGRILDVTNVIWCTGFRHDFPWIDLPVFGEDGQPLHDRGVVEQAPGLYFIGLVFQYSLASCVLPGIGRDHAYVANHLAGRLRERRLPRRRAGGGRVKGVADADARARTAARSARSRPWRG